MASTTIKKTVRMSCARIIVSRKNNLIGIFFPSPPPLAPPEIKVEGWLQQWLIGTTVVLESQQTHHTNQATTYYKPSTVTECTHAGRLCFWKIPRSLPMNEKILTVQWSSCCNWSYTWLDLCGVKKGSSGGRGSRAWRMSTAPLMTTAAFSTSKVGTGTTTVPQLSAT